ncbi:hypothetical protein D3C87_1856790 [compost metagenome]
MAAFRALGGDFQEHDLCRAAVQRFRRRLADKLQHAAVLRHQLQPGLGTVAG